MFVLFLKKMKSAERGEVFAVPLSLPSLLFSPVQFLPSSTVDSPLTPTTLLFPDRPLFSPYSFPPFPSPRSSLLLEPSSNAPLLRPVFSLLLLHSTLFSICAHSLPFQPSRYLPSRFHTLMRTLVRLNDTINSLNEPWNNGIK